MQILALVCNSSADGGGFHFSLVVFTALENGAWLSLGSVCWQAALAPLLLHAMVDGSGLRRHMDLPACSQEHVLLLSCVTQTNPPTKAQQGAENFSMLFASVNPSKNIIWEKYNATCAGLWS